MKLRLMTMLVCVIAYSVTAFAEKEQSDFGYWRLKSGNYEYSVQQTAFSNATVCSGWSYSLVLALSVNNMSDRIEVSFHKIISEDGVGLGPKLKDRLENESRQLEGITGAFTVGRNDNKLEVVKSANPFADAFLGQMRKLLAFPTPKKLTDNMVWTNSASLFSAVNPQLLKGHNGSNEQFIISSASIKDCDNRKQEKIPAFSLGDPSIIIDRRLDQISVLSLSITVEKMLSNIQTLKFVGDNNREPKAIKHQ